MATTAQHIAATEDADLQRRLVAAAQQAGIPDAQVFVARNIGSLVNAQVDPGGQKVSDVHAYAAEVRETYLADDRAMSPGLNPGAVTDPMLAAAVAAVSSAEPAA